MTAVYVGLGGNQGDVLDSFRRALRELNRHPKITLDDVGCAYKTAPWTPDGWDPQRVAPYWNTVARLMVRCAPSSFLGVLQRIEKQLGRVRTVRWGPRTLDLDILVFGSRVIETPQLVIPHPGLARRLFVLRPLADLAPQLLVPKHACTVERLLAEHSDVNMGILHRESDWFVGRSAQQLARTTRAS